MDIIDQQNVRPWQGTVLGIANILGLAMGALMLTLVMFGSSFLAGMAQDPVFSFIFGAGALVIILLVLPFIVLEVFITIGMFKGQKWAVIVMLIFTVIALLGGLGGLFANTDGYHSYVSVAVHGFLLYCEIASLKDPFYK